MGVLVVLIGLVAAAFWLLAAGSALELVIRHRRHDRSALWYALRGYAFWSRESFGRRADGAHARFRIGFIGFFSTVAAMGGLLALLSVAE